MMKKLFLEVWSRDVESLPAQASHIGNVALQVVSERSWGGIGLPQILEPPVGLFKNPTGTAPENLGR